MNKNIARMVANGLIMNQAELIDNLITAFDANPQLMEFLADPTQPEYSIEKAQKYLDENLPRRNRTITSYEVYLRTEMIWEAKIYYSEDAWFKDQEDADSHNSYRSRKEEDEEHPIKGTIESYVTTCIYK